MIPAQVTHRPSVLGSLRRVTDAADDARPSVLTVPAFRLLAAARTVSVLGGAFGPIALSFGVLQMPGGGPAALSLVLACEAAPQLLFVLFGGVLGDRVRSRFRLIACTEAAAAALWGIQAALFLTHSPIAAIAACAAFGGFTRALFSPALEGAVVDVVGKDQQQAANAALKVGTNTASLIGMLIAGITVSAVGPAMALMIDAVSFGACAVVFAMLRRRVPSGAPAYKGGYVAAARDGWREFVRHEWLWSTTAMFALVVAAVNCMAGLVGPMLAAQSLGGAWAWSMVVIAQATGQIAGAGWAAALKPRRPMLVATVATAGAGLPAALMAGGAPLAVVMAGAVVHGVSWDVAMVLWRTCLQREVPKESISRVSSIDLLGALTLAPLALAAVGPLAAAYGPRHIAVVCAALVWVPVGLALLSRDVRTLPGGTTPSTRRALAADTR